MVGGANLREGLLLEPCDSTPAQVTCIIICSPFREEGSNSHATYQVHDAPLEVQELYVGKTQYT
jgi:hypothetical protein